MRKSMEIFAKKGSSLTNCGPTVRANSSMRRYQNSSMRRYQIKRERKMTIPDEDKLGASLLLYLSESTGKPKSLVVEEEEEEEEEEAKLRNCALILVQMKHSLQYQSEEEENEEEAKHEDVLPQKKAKKEKLAEQESKQKPKKKKEIVEVDDSEETLAILRQWNRTKPEKPPREMVDPDLVGVCSELMRKQLVVSDVKGSLCRLMLGTMEVKKMMLSVFEKTESVGTDGLQVSVYGTNGKVYEMMLKMWNKNTVPVLMNALWNKFVADYGLMKYRDFLTVWMFRHRESGKICLAIDYTRFDSITKKLSPRISKLVFKNPN